MPNCVGEGNFESKNMRKFRSTVRFDNFFLPRRTSMVMVNVSRTLASNDFAREAAARVEVAGWGSAASMGGSIPGKVAAKNNLP